MSINPTNTPDAAIPPISLECCMFMLCLNSPLPLNSPHPSLCPPTSPPAHLLVHPSPCPPARLLAQLPPIFFRACQYVALNGNSGKPMAKHPSCSFYRWFPQLLAFPSIINLIRSSSPSLSYSPTFTSSQPATSTPSSSEATMFPFPSTQPPMKPNGKKPQKRGEKCVGSFCQRLRALRCTCTMCLTHCTNAGGCAIHPVDTEIVYDYEGMSAEEEFELPADEQADMAPLEPGVDSGDTGHEVLRQALAMSLAMQRHCNKGISDTKSRKDRNSSHSRDLHQIRPMHYEFKLNKLMFRDLDVGRHSTIVCPDAILDTIVVMIIGMTFYDNEITTISVE
ncbi:hypothetical protein F4604DRAFT_1913514 [Suillus subluteus]|nr:hypothetical protein F4604DRAFT_1913514 [Suillus subluteus]